MPPPRLPIPVVQAAEWPWASLLDALLHLGGWSVEEVLLNPEAARRFGRLWDLAQELARRKAERERRLEIEEVLWWRRQGCPVPCPLCISAAECGCH
ncbi:MAG: hypothetical protein HY717_24130 [Planctomycetes bacterium]|nr:hypothetical protein [Planctomycetota bacterium]